MRADYLRPQAYAKLFSVMTYENVLALRLSLETGLRIDDVLSLRPEDLKGQSLSFTAKKTGKKGRKTISAPLAREIRKQASALWLFPGRKKGQHRTRQAVWRNVTKARQTLGYAEHISPHSARKTYAVELRRSDGLAAVQKELQHSRSDVTMLYAFADMVGETPPPPPQGAELSSQRWSELAELVAERVVEKLLEKYGKTLE